MKCEKRVVDNGKEEKSSRGEKVWGYHMHDELEFTPRISVSTKRKEETS